MRLQIGRVMSENNLENILHLFLIAMSMRNNQSEIIL